MRRSFRTRVNFSGWIPRVGTLGWYAMPRQGMGSEMWFGGRGIGNVVIDWLQWNCADTLGRDALMGHGRGIENVVADLPQRGHTNPMCRDAPVGAWDVAKGR
jgi:hypothetical protein